MSTNDRDGAINRYLDGVKRALAEETVRPEWFNNTDSILNGGPAEYVAKAIAREDRRSSSIFLTPQRISAALVRLTPNLEAKYERFFDPACGAGDLLISIARRLPLGNSLPDTLSAWSARLSGCDTIPAFVDLAKGRLALLARARHRTEQGLLFDSSRLFPNITVANALGVKSQYATADLIIANPPFHQQVCPKEIHWASGKVNSAALFVHHALANLPTASRISAVLPEVLRSGSRYREWRKSVTALSRVNRLLVWGQFEPSVDIDVFLISMTRESMVGRPCLGRNREKAAHSKGTIGERFTLSIGPVVPFRDKASQAPRPYIKPRDLAPWKTCTPVTSIRTDGPGCTPPFVVVRRTSRPGDKRRAVGTIVVGKEEVAVENHLGRSDAERRTPRYLCKLNQATKYRVN